MKFHAILIWIESYEYSYILQQNRSICTIFAYFTVTKTKVEGEPFQEYRTAHFIDRSFFLL